MRNMLRAWLFYRRTYQNLVEKKAEPIPTLPRAVCCRLCFAGGAKFSGRPSAGPRKIHKMSDTTFGADTFHHNFFQVYIFLMNHFVIQYLYGFMAIGLVFHRIYQFLKVHIELDSK
jgi:hypothetical protein